MAETLTVASLWERIGECLEPLRDHTFRLRGRIADLKPTGSASHRYFTLVDPDGAAARIGAVIWRSNTSRIDAALRAAKLGPMTNDMEIVVAGRVSPYPPSGRVSLVVHEIDAEATRLLSRLELEAIRAKLRAEGIFAKNRSLEVPLVPLRLGLVTSDQGTVQHDVRVALEEERFRFEVRMYPAPVTGADAADALAAVIATADAGGHDLLLLVRGGGSESELMLFNQEVVVRAVARASTPVWCAIGHTADEVLVNEVANQAFTVPRAVGVAVRERVEAFLGGQRAIAVHGAGLAARWIDQEDHVVAHTRALSASAAGRASDGANHWLGSIGREAERAAREALRDYAGGVRALGQQIEWTGAELVREHRKELQGLRHGARESTRLRVDEARRDLGSGSTFLPVKRWVEDTRGEVMAVRRLLAAHDPATRLAEGYAVLMDPDGRWLRTRSDVARAGRVRAQMQGGEVALEVVDAG